MVCALRIKINLIFKNSINSKAYLYIYIKKTSITCFKKFDKNFHFSSPLKLFYVKVRGWKWQSWWRCSRGWPAWCCCGRVGDDVAEDGQHAVAVVGGGVVPAASQGRLSLQHLPPGKPQMSQNEQRHEIKRIKLSNMAGLLNLAHLPRIFSNNFLKDSFSTWDPEPVTIIF